MNAARAPDAALSRALPLYAKLVAVAAIWGGTFIGGRVAAPAMGASAASLWRYVVASAGLAVAAALLERGLPWLTPRQWFGVAIGRGDPFALLSAGGGLGEAFIFGAVLSWAAFTLVARRLMSGLSPLAVTTYASLTGTLMLAAAAQLDGAPLLPEAPLHAWLAIAFLGVFGTAVAFVWYNDGVRRLGPARAAVFINFVPVAAVALGWLLLGERVEASMLAGGALVLAGVYALNSPSRAA